MSVSPTRFADLLTNAIYAIRARTGQDLATIQDELGYALQRETGGSAIVYWRKGYVPAALTELEHLAQLLVARQALDQRTCHEFLRSGGHPAPEQVMTAWFASQGEAVAPDKDSSPPSMPLNPFVVGPPILVPRQFFGRERELRRIFGRWQGLPLEHFALIGPRRSGKSSLLHYLQRIATTPPAQLRPGQKHNWLPQPQQMRWVFVDFQDARMQQQAALLPHLLTQLVLETPLPCTLDRFMETLTAQPWAQPTVILMDEIGAGLAAPDLDANFWQSWRALINNPNIAGQLAFVVAAHAPLVQLAADHQKTSPFFNVFNTLALGSWSEPEAQALIASAPIPFAAEDSTWILRESGGWPLLVQTLCDARFSALQEGEQSDKWKAEGLQRIAPFRYLLQPAEIIKP